VRRVAILRPGAGSRRVVFEARTEMAKVCQTMADKAGEPPMDEQD
jgi:hypothetical protein